MYNSTTVGWFVFIDDDSLVYMENLMNIAKQYDPIEPWMIGGVSQAIDGIDNLGSVPFGGGGILLSRRAVQLAVSAADCCLAQYSGLEGGDELLARCVADVGVPFIKNDGFNQFDVRGDVSGYIEGVVSSAHPVVSMHHLYLQDSMLLPVNNSFTASYHLMQSYLSLPHKDQYFQRSIMYGHTNRSGLVTVQITRGFSVVVFPGRVRVADIIFRVEETFVHWGPKRSLISTRPRNAKQKRYNQSIVCECIACQVAALCSGYIHFT
jgi:hypothetical protein